MFCSMYTQTTNFGCLQGLYIYLQVLLLNTRICAHHGYHENHKRVSLVNSIIFAQMVAETLCP